MKKLFFYCLVCCITITLWAQNTTVQFAFVNTHERILPEQIIDDSTLHHHWKAIAWKGERVHTPIILKSPTSLEHVTYTVTLVDKKNKKNKLMPQLGLVNEVIAGTFGRGCSESRTPSSDLSTAFDPIIFTKQSTHLTANKNQLLWLSIAVPSTAQAGVYKGFVTLKTNDKKWQLPFTIQVTTQRLPKPAQWKIHLDLWQHPAAIARVEGLPLWSDAHFKAMRPYYTMLAKAGQKVITTSIINEPWEHQTYDDYPSLIRWIKQKNGTWKYDYTLFDKYVSFVMDCGITQQIDCYTMIPWQMSFLYFDEALNKEVVLTAQTSSKAYQDFWTSFLIDFEKHLKSKKWFEKTCIAMDERKLQDMKNVIKLLKDLNPKWKIKLSGNDYEPSIAQDIYDYSIASKFLFDEDLLQSRKRNKQKSTYYTCCVERFPNGFTFSHPYESTYLGWYAYAKGFDGYLRWAYNSWPAHPLQDSKGARFPAGDTFQIYPYAHTSIRFEKLVEGIQDYEKLTIIAQWLEKNNKTQELKDLQDILQGFDLHNITPTKALNALIKAKKWLNKYNNK